jgi:carboxyl-terminal processing protease
LRNPLEAEMKNHMRTLQAWTILLYLAGGFAGAYALEPTPTHETREAQRLQLVQDSDEIKLLIDVFTIVLDNYVESPRSKDLIYGAIRGMLETLDPRTYLMDPELYKEIQLQTQGGYASIGIGITVEDHQHTVARPIGGSPADRAGIRAEDLILKIDGQPTEAMTWAEAERKFRGFKGTPVTVTIVRGYQEPFDLTLTREITKVHSPWASDLGDGIGYIRIGSFRERTVQHLKVALKGLNEQGMRGLILDLRNNPGGLLSQVVSTTDLFLKKGRVIVSMEARVKNQDLQFLGEQEKPETVPMVVLVNRGTSSGSEIVAAALQDHKRAILLGTQTAGEVSIQTVIPLHDGSGLRLTTAKFFTPKRRNIHGSGITPDIVFEPLETAPVDLKSDVWVQRAEEILKARLLKN